MKIFVVLVLVFITVVRSQYWTIHNQTSVIQQGPGFRHNVTVVNTSYVQNPGYGPVGHPQQQQPQYGFRGNYDPYGGYINQTAGGWRNSKNDLQVGRPAPGDNILFKQWYTKAARWLQIREKTISYPVTPWRNTYSYQATITAVGIFDLAKGPGGHATIISGGVGHKNVTIRLYSDRSCGFNYKIVIHGR